jgi:Skp family chaperone for outer membrane proteins
MAAERLNGRRERSPSIGVVDVQRVLSESIAGMAARQRLEDEKATMQRTLDRRSHQAF